MPDSDPVTAARTPAAPQRGSSAAPATDSLDLPRPPREQQAWDEIGVTRFSPGVQWFLVIAFLAICMGPPVVQHFVVSAESFQRLKGSAEPTEGAVSGPHVEGTVVGVSAGPRTDGVYSDFLMKLHVRDLRAGTPGDPSPPAEAVVVVQAMRDRVVLEAASVRIGDKVSLVLTPWDAVKARVGGINASELADPALLRIPQLWAESLRRAGAGRGPGPSDFFAVFAGVGSDLAPEDRVPVVEGAVREWTRAKGGLLRSFLAANGHVARRISAFERSLEDDNVLTLASRPTVQEWLARAGVGNEKAYLGRDGWLFYEPGVRAITGPPFLDPVQLRRQSRGGDAFNAPPQPDPRIAIRELRADLARRGIELVLLPTPVKLSIHPGHFTARLEGFPDAVRNRSYDAFIHDIQSADRVRVFDPATLLKTAAMQGEPQYLATDTHWRPEAMERVAVALADRLRAEFTLPGGDTRRFRAVERELAQIGDIGKMLGLPGDQRIVRPERVRIRQVQPLTVASAPGSPAVLLLGDSFSNIYSLGGMGWGESAGFGEHLELALEQPVKRLVRNDAGAHATRQMLRESLVRDPAYLDGVKVVVWQFAERELAVGDWKRIALPEPASAGAAPAAGTPAQVSSAPAGRAETPEQALAALGALGVESIQGKRQALVGRQDWLFLASELRHLGAGPFWGAAAAGASQAGSDPDPELAIVDLHRKLDALGIGLIVMPVPARAAIYPDRLLDGLPTNADGIPARIDLQHQAFYARLREAGVRVLDLTDDFLAARAADATLGPVVCQQDTHWSPRGIEIAADRLVEEIGEPEWLAQAGSLERFRLAPQTLSILGDLVKRVPDHPETRTDLPATLVSSTRETFSRIPPSDQSPVILLADSHGLVFHTGGDMHAEGAGLADHLADRLGIAIDVMARRGSGASVRVDLARRFLQEADTASTKRLVIYCFAARFLTESDSWKPVPLQQ